MSLKFNSNSRDDENSSEMDLKGKVLVAGNLLRTYYSGDESTRCLPANPQEPHNKLTPVVETYQFNYPQIICVQRKLNFHNLLPLKRTFKTKTSQ